jgi:hypothetical protein
MSAINARTALEWVISNQMVQCLAFIAMQAAARLFDRSYSLHCENKHAQN